MTMFTGVVPWTAQDVPQLRRELLGWLDSNDGVAAYLLAIAIGRQPLCPPGDPRAAAATLARSERDRLDQARLWFIDRDMCAVVQSAYPTMPAFAAQEFDLPSRYGFVLFGTPIGTLTAEQIGVPNVLTDGSPLSAAVAALGSRVVAASWSPMNVPGVRIPHSPAGGVWMTFYAESNLPRITPGAGDEYGAALEAARTGARITPDDEIAFAWCPPGLPEAGRTRFVINTAGVSSAAKWASMLLATFQLAQQTDLFATVQEPVARAERRRTERAGHRPVDGIRVVQMRRRAPRTVRPAAGQRTGKTFTHRWWIADHCRNVWYPSQQVHRPRWFPPTLAVPEGCENAPILGSDKVTKVRGPR
jgi:hypothetical protein